MYRILVTGGAGFIGQRTIRALVDHGYRVRALDRLTAPVHPRGEWPAAMPRVVDCQLGDVQSAADLRKALKGIDVVLHLAAYQDYLTDFSQFIRVNAAGTALLFELIVAERLPIKKVVIASSQAVYGEGAYICQDHGQQFPNTRNLEQLRLGDWDIRCRSCGEVMTPRPVVERYANPQNPYGISKLCQELLAIQLGMRYGIATVALRYSITQGAGQSFHNAYSGICRIFALCALEGKALPIYEDGGQLRDYVYVGDVVAANLLAIHDARTDFEVFNVGGRERFTVLEYAALISKVAQVELMPDLSGKFRVGDTRHIVSDSTKLRALGWRQTKTTTEVIEEYLTWAQSQPRPADVTGQALARMQSLGAVGVGR